MRDPVEVIAGRSDTHFVLTCEHASNELPHGLQWHEEDHWLVETHWAFDLGIADVTRALARHIGAPAALARFSRLLIDANRPIDHETAFRTHADGRIVHLNRGLTEAERARRAALLHEPYHTAIDALVAEHQGSFVLSMHSFTPVYEGGPPRPMEIGVLFDEEEEVSARIARSLAQDGFAVALNEPYSGRDGLIYAASRHAERHGRRALELEIRQDLATDERRRSALIAALERALHGALSPEPAP